MGDIESKLGDPSLCSTYFQSPSKYILVCFNMKNYLIKIINMNIEVSDQDFWVSSSIAGLSNSAAASTGRRRFLWILILLGMPVAYVI